MTLIDDGTFRDPFKQDFDVFEAAKAAEKVASTCKEILNVDDEHLLKEVFAQNAKDIPKKKLLVAKKEAVGTNTDRNRLDVLYQLICKEGSSEDIADAIQDLKSIAVRVVNKV